MLNLNQSSRLIRVVYFRLVMGMILLMASVSLQAEEVTQQYLGYKCQPGTRGRQGVGRWCGFNFTRHHGAQPHGDYQSKSTGAARQ